LAPQSSMHYHRPYAAAMRPTLKIDGNHAVELN